MKKSSVDVGMKKVSSAVVNMSALIDDIVKKARKNFGETGSADVDAKFLKESVSALRELFDLLSEQGEIGTADGITIKFEKAIEDWNK
ncbi:MAG: hypothetical protein E7557_01570 [Ruminococcaceae bacterium]|nr:hypothetical protein [Oscillospiraceae bacterium]